MSLDFTCMLENYSFFFSNQVTEMTVRKNIALYYDLSI